MTSQQATSRMAGRPNDQSMVVPIEAAVEQGLPQVGGKASNLGRLSNAGFNVPAGVVLTTDAFDRFLEENQQLVRSHSVAEAEASFPGSVSPLIDEVVASFGDIPLAVRSSGVSEDADHASYAGQYESILDVRGTAGVKDAILKCWLSAFSHRVGAYRAQQDAAPDEKMAIAVIVQQLIPADAAGVAFTADPVTGDRDVTIINAVQGLGDRMVSGSADPDEWRVYAEEVEEINRPERAITRDQASEITRVARQIEETFGAPQDIEWAINDGEISILQARPITGLPQKPELDIPTEGTWQKDTTHYPELMTPFGASVFLPSLEIGIQRMSEEFGLLIDRVEQRCLGGEIYGRPVPVGEKDGPPPPWWVLGILSRIIPAMRKRLNAAQQVIDQGLLEELPRQWDQQERDRFIDEATSFLNCDYSRLSDRDLIVQLDAACDFHVRGQIMHFRLFLPYAVPLYELVTTCHELFGWRTNEALELLSGLSHASSGPARALSELAGRVRKSPDAMCVLENPEPGVRARLAEADRDISAAFDEYIDRFGHRSIGYDPGSPTLAERPQLLARLIIDAVSSSSGSNGPENAAKRRQQAESKARALLPSKPAEDRERFEHVLSRARETYSLREDNVFWTDNVPNGVIRTILVECGRRLCDRNVLRDVEDAAYLEYSEVRDALLSETPPDLAELASQRRTERAWVAANPGPPFLGPAPSPPPDVRGLPAAARRINAAMMWIMGEEYPVPGDDATTGLSGIAGSAGRYTGTVRVIRSEAEFDRLRPGDVLVCPVTTPTWSVLFPNAGALVTDGGGRLAHAAIVAREYGIPAVLGTRTATRHLADGQVVTVDGTGGFVELVDET